MTSRGRPSAKLYICGLGHCPPHTATVAVLHALGGCDVIFVADGSEVGEVLAEFCPGVPRRSYGGVGAANTVLRELARGRAVGVASQGHPFVLNGLVESLLLRCRKRGIAIETFGAVSALDMVLAKLGKSLGLDIRAIQAYEASRLVSGAAVVLGDWLIVTFPERSGPAQARGVARVLRRRYPPQHFCWLLGPGPNDPPAKLSLTEIEAVLGHSKPGHILVAPPLGARARR